MNAVVSPAPILPSRPSAPTRRRGRLTREQVIDVFLSTEPTGVCGQRLGITGAAVSMIRNRKMWADVTKDLERPAAVKPRARLTREKAIDIFLSTDPNRPCAARHDTSPSNVSLIRNRRIWADATEGLERPASTSPDSR